MSFLSADLSFLRSGIPDPLYVRIAAETDFSDISASMKFTVLRKLFKAAADYPNCRNQAGKLALKLEMDAREYETVEAHEEALLHDLRDEIESRRAYLDVRHKWAVVTTKEKLNHLMGIAQLQAKIFGFLPAKQMRTFALSRGEHQALAARRVTDSVYPAALAGKENGGIIEFNIHPDADGLGNYNDSVLSLVHEQNHIQQFQLVSRKLKPSHPYSVLSCSLAISGLNPWKDDERMGYHFYRASMIERHSFAIEDKFSAMCEGRRIRPESALLKDDMSKLVLNC